jgi:hypothetical protein
MSTFTMVTRHGISKDQIVGYTLISSDYRTVYKSVEKLVNEITFKQITVTNLDVEGGKLVATNGAMDKYTLINVANNNRVEGEPKAVILDRVENKENGKLLGYTIFTHTGTLAEVSVADAVVLANRKLISNGKIRHTEQGDIVSSINGNYPLRQIEIAKAPRGEITVELMLFSTIYGTNVEYCCATIGCTSAAQMSVLAAEIHKSNAKIVAESKKAGGAEAAKSLQIQRTGANSLYAAIDNETLTRLLKAGAMVTLPIGMMIVSVINYTDKEGGFVESTLKLNQKWGVTDADEGSRETYGRLGEYGEKLVATYKPLVKFKTKVFKAFQ